MSKATKKSKRTVAESVSQSLTKYLAEVVNEVLPNDEARESLMSAWEGRSTQVVKLLNSKLGTSKTTVEKKVKDPNAPRKPKSAYLLFCDDKRDSVKKAHPGIGPTQVMQQLGAMWKKCTPKQKEKYAGAVAKDRARYEEEMAQYVPPDNVVLTKHMRRKKDPNAPKKPLSSYIIYSNLNRKVVNNENPDMKAKDVTVELGKRWQALTAEQKVPYEEKAAEDKVRYARELEAYQQTTADANNEVKTEAKSETKTEEKKTAPRRKKNTAVARTASGAATQKKPKSGYALFCRETRGEVLEDHPDWTKNQVNSELKLMWSELDDDEKASFTDRL